MQAIWDDAHMRERERGGDRHHYYTYKLCKAKLTGPDC